VSGRKALLPLLGALSLAVPAPPATAGTITVSLCGGGSVQMPLGGDAPADDSGCCKKACHACQQRKSRKGKSAPDGCC